MAQAQEEARAELDGIRGAMERTIGAAGQIASIAMRYAAKLAPADREQMAKEIEAAQLQMAKERFAVTRAESRVPGNLSGRPRNGGDVISG